MHQQRIQNHVVFSQFQGKTPILSKFWAQGPPPLGVTTLLCPPDQNPGSAPVYSRLQWAAWPGTTQTKYFTNHSMIHQQGVIGRLTLGRVHLYKIFRQGNTIQPTQGEPAHEGDSKTFNVSPDVTRNTKSLRISQRLFHQCHFCYTNPHTDTCTVRCTVGLNLNTGHLQARWSFPPGRYRVLPDTVA